MLLKEEIVNNLKGIKEDIDKISAREITIVAVTKTLPANIYDICHEIDLIHIGENRVQELKAKSEEKSNLRDKLKFHLIGHLQTNKVKFLHSIADSYDTLDSIETLKKIEKIQEEKSYKKLPVLLQINAANEPGKAGIPLENLQAIEEITKLCVNSHAVNLEGLFSIGPTPENMTEKEFELKTRECFRKTRELKEKLESNFNISLPRLSMGMSSDYKWAIEEGASEIRLGSIIFGSRS